MLKLIEHPVISAIWQDEDFSKAVKSPSSLIFHHGASIVSVAERIREAHDAGKKIFINLDMALGIGRDRHGVEFLKNSGADGLISTKNGIIACAKEFGLITVQRFFIIDSQAVSSALDNIRQGSPDMVELLPGVIPSVVQKFSRAIKQPVLAGGLIKTREDIMRALSSGATAISTATEELWYL